MRALAAVRRLVHLLGIDPAVGFTVLARCWTILSGSLTVLLIAHFLSPAEQGYYYTFASLVSLQVLFELGFSFVILQLAAHETSQLQISSIGVITGNRLAHSRLASVLQKSIRWYSRAAFAMAVILIPSGFYFFSVHTQNIRGVAWKAPWYLLVVAAMFTFQIDPVFSFLEGCGFVAKVARIRFSQAVAGSCLAWIAFILHRGLFAPGAIILGQAIAGIVSLLSQRRLILGLLRYPTTEGKIGWRTEIWPFQWRMAVSFLFGSFIYPLFNPILFAYRGAAEAGRMGMSLSIAGALGAVAYSWMNTKAAPFGGMVARKDYASLDNLFFRTLVQSAAFLFTADCLLLAFLGVVDHIAPQFKGRMLPLPIFAVLMLTVWLSHIVFCEAIYLRAHKREPFFLLQVTVGTAMAVSTFLTARLWGATGVTFGYLICCGAGNLLGGTLLFIKRRRAWHSDSSENVCTQGAVTSGTMPNWRSDEI